MFDLLALSVHQHGFSVCMALVWQELWEWPDSIGELHLSARGSSSVLVPV